MSRTISLTSNRLLLTDMLQYAQRIPTVPVARRMALADVALARRHHPASPSWTCLFMRAYGIVCERFNCLRRCWLARPRPRLYEHPESYCFLAVEREWRNETELFFGSVRGPENSSLDMIQGFLRRYKESDITSIAEYRRQLRSAWVPGWVRRAALRLKLDWSGPRRVRYIGTFGLTNYGMLGAESLHPIGPQTTVMTLGPIADNGEMTVKLVYDHRVLDGGYVARCLDHLEEVLHARILAELRTSAQAA